MSKDELSRRDLLNSTALAAAGLSVLALPDAAAAATGAAPAGESTTTTEATTTTTTAPTIGIVDLAFDPNADGTVRALAIQPVDGKILVGGSFSTIGEVSRSRIARLNTDGTVDETFVIDGDGFIIGDLYALAVQTDGKVLVGGTHEAVGGVSRKYIARLNANGSLDDTFESSLNWIVQAIVVQPDGKILIGGEFTLFDTETRNRIARLNSDGTLDNTFDSTAANGLDDVVYSIALQSDGKIIVGGRFTTAGIEPRSYIARFNADGSLDSGFAPVFSSIVQVVKIRQDGKIFVGGSFSTVSGVESPGIALLNSNGSLDTAFDPSAGGGVDGTVRVILEQTDGKIIIGGGFDYVGTTVRNNIARLNANGSLDTGYDPNASSTIRAMAAQTDGKVLIGGQFRNVDGITRNRLARLN